MWSNISTPTSGPFSTSLHKVYMQNRHTGKKWMWLTSTSPKHPDSSIRVRRPLLQMLQAMAWRESCQWNHQLTGRLSFGATGLLLTSTFLPDLLCFPGFEDGVVCIHCILIWQEGNIECPQQLWRSRSIKEWSVGQGDPFFSIGRIFRLPGCLSHGVQIH